MTDPTKYKNQAGYGHVIARRGHSESSCNNLVMVHSGGEAFRASYLSPEDALKLAGDIRSAAQEILDKRPQYAVRRDDSTFSTYKYQVFNHRKANNPIGIFESVVIAEQYAHRLNNGT